MSLSPKEVDLLVLDKQKATFFYSEDMSAPLLAISLVVLSADQKLQKLSDSTDQMHSMLIRTDPFPSVED